MWRLWLDPRLAKFETLNTASQHRTPSEHVLFGVRVEDCEHGTHGDHIKATRHFWKQQIGWDFDVESEGVEKYEAKDDHGNDQVEVLERVLELSSPGAEAPF